MNPAVLQAIEELKAEFGSENVLAEADGSGGAFVSVNNLRIGEKYSPDVIWCGFTLTFSHPQADVYPHFVTADLKRRDGAPLGETFSGPTTWNNKQAIQISRKSNRWNPSYDSAVTKLHQILEWIKSR